MKLPVPESPMYSSGAESAAAAQVVRSAAAGAFRGQNVRHRIGSARLREAAGPVVADELLDMRKAGRCHSGYTFRCCRRCIRGTGQLETELVPPDCVKLPLPCSRCTHRMRKAGRAAVRSYVPLLPALFPRYRRRHRIGPARLREAAAPGGADGLSGAGKQAAVRFIRSAAAELYPRSDMQTPNWSRPSA